MAATLVGMEIDSAADLTPRPSFSNFPSAKNLQYNTPEMLDDWVPFGSLPPSSPPDYNNLSDQGSAGDSVLPIEGIEHDEKDVIKAKE